MNQSPRQPALVQEALQRADRLAFTLSCEDFIGRSLSVLAASVPPNSRILDIGTGAGVSLAWIVSGLSHREDVSVITVDTDSNLLSEVSSSQWPPFVQFIEGDGADEVERQGEFDLIFADAPGGKLSNMAGTLSALRINGLLALDDMNLDLHEDDPELRDQLQKLTATLLSDHRLLCLETPVSSGLILAVRRE